MRCAVPPTRCRHKAFAREPPNNALQALDAKRACNLVGRYITGSRHLGPLVRAALVAKHYSTTTKKVDQNGNISTLSSVLQVEAAQTRLGLEKGEEFGSSD